MELQNTGIDGMIIDFKPLNDILGLHAFIKGEAWDYERVTFDYKIPSSEKGVTYYVRIQGYALEGDIDKGDAVVKLLTPLLGKHYYPHGIEYGEDENFPTSLIERATNLVSRAKEALEKYSRTDYEEEQ